MDYSEYIQSEAPKRSQLLQQFGEEGGSDVPRYGTAYGEYGDYQLVGHGDVTNAYCGKFASFWGCLRVELHNHKTLDGLNSKGKVFVHKVFNSCDKPSCPICFRSWAVREAGRMERRLKEASKVFGIVEHIVVSVPTKDYGMTDKCLRKKVSKMLFGLGVLGGAITVHDFREDDFGHWYFSRHFHVLGFIAGGYSRCRHCSGADCYKCGGFEGKCYKMYRENGYIVRVLGERKTIGGTAFYELTHASIKKGVKRFHVATWFASCSYRKLKVSVEYRDRVCPLCGHDLERLRYFGGRDLFSDETGSEFFADFMEDGLAVWFIDARSYRGDG
jgi:hypothetical protein